MVLDEQWGEVGGYTLYSVGRILEDDDLPRLLPAGMIPIGYAANGDPLVFCFTQDKCAVGLVSHDEFWGTDIEPQNAYVEVSASIDEYLWRAAEGRYLPIDYYAATELLALRREVDGSRDA